MLGWVAFVELNTLAYGFVGGIILGVAQWFILRKKVANPEWWVVFTATGMALGQIVFNLMFPVFTETVAGISFDLIYGVITGIGIYLIASRSLEQDFSNSVSGATLEPVLSQNKPQQAALMLEGKEKMKLNVNGKTVSDAPDENMIDEILESLVGQKDGFAILSRTEMTYIQAAYIGAGDFVVEYQDGSTTEHFECISADLDVTKVTEAFVFFLNADNRLLSEFTWEQMMI